MIDTVARDTEKFKTHPSVLIIKEKNSQVNKFSVAEVSQSQIDIEIKNLNAKKATTHRNITLKLSNIKVIVTAETLQQHFNLALTTGKFPSNLKNADVTSISKRKIH